MTAICKDRPAAASARSGAVGQGLPAASDVSGGSGQRREQILDAAGHCFGQDGFHRTTMQDIAGAARMSPGNIYRYFDSKEAVVLGLAERERQRGFAFVARLHGDADRRAELTGIIAQHFVALPREVAMLRVELWAEATRNPAIAAIVTSHEREGTDWLADVFAALATSPHCDIPALVALTMIQLKGIVVSRALRAGYDAGAAVDRLYALIDAGLTGCLPLPATTGNSL